MERLRYLLLLGILVLFLALGWQTRVPPTGSTGDDKFVYLALSESLESGSYREIYRPAAPLHVQYPPAFPAWLMFLRNVASPSLELAGAANLLAVAVAIGLLFIVARPLIGTNLALVLALLLALNRGLLFTGSVLSEAPYILLSTAALALALPDGKSSSRLRVFGAISLALLAFLTRSMGLALVFAVGYWLWSQRRRGALLAWVSGAVLVVGGWFTYAHFARSSAAVQSYASQFRTVQTGSGGVVLGLVKRVADHVLRFATTGMPSALSLPTVAGTRVDNLAWLVVSILLGAAGFVALWRKWPAAALYTFLYLGLFLVWPWQDGRLLTPVVPLLLLMLLLGARRLAGILPRRAGAFALGILVVLLTFGAFQGAWDRLSQYRHCDRRRALSDPGCSSELRQSMAAAGEYLRVHVPESEVILTQNPAGINFSSGHLTEPSKIFRSVQPDSLPAMMLARGIRYALVTEGWVAAALLESCRNLRVESGWPPDAVLISIPSSAGEGPGACDALRDLSRSPDDL